MGCRQFSSAAGEDEDDNVTGDGSRRERRKVSLQCQLINNIFAHFSSFLYIFVIY